MSSLSDFNGNGAAVNFDYLSAFQSKRESLLLQLNNQVHQFKENSSTENPSDTSQHRQKLQRQVTAKILKSIQDLLLLPLTIAFRDFRKTLSSAIDDVVDAVLILVDEWGMGDFQVCTALVEALNRSYAAAKEPSYDGLQGIESFQHFVLLDLLPHVINGDTENCNHAQSMVANALVQIVCSYGVNFALTSPIIQWCRWQLDNVYPHRRSSLHNFPLIDTEPHKLVLPSEVQELGLVLLRNVHSPNLLPSAFRIVLDHISVIATCNAINSAMMYKHASDSMSLLRQRLIDFTSIRVQSKSDSEGIHEESMPREKQNSQQCLWQRQLVQVIVMALNEETAHQSELLTAVYLQQLMVTMEKTPKSMSDMTINGKDADLNGLGTNAFHCKSDNIHPQLLALDWIVISFLFSKLSISSQQRSLLFEICDSLCEFEQDARTCCAFSVYQSLMSAMKVLLLQDHDVGMEISEATPVIACDTLELGSFQQELVSGLLILDVALLLSSSRAVASRTEELMGPFVTNGISFPSSMIAHELFRFPTTMMSAPSWVHDFTLNLFECLDSHRQAEFVTILLQLVDETALQLQRCATSESPSKFWLPHRPWKRQVIAISEQHLDEATIGENYDRKTLVLRSVCSILICLAEKSPKAFLCFKEELFQRLLLPAFEELTLNNEVVRPICKILVSLWSIPEHCCDSDCNQRLKCSEVLLLVQKLLFGEPSRVGTSRVVRGIVLATELLETRSNNSILMENRKRIQEWVVQCLLPSTRRMVDPEIGLSGLLFLQSWIDRNERSDENMANAIVFNHFKMIVANTGLIQMVDTYQASGNYSDSSLLGYSSSIGTSDSLVKDQRERDRPLPRAMLFGICFFLRHAGNIELCPGRWNFATDWVYSLVDKYLHMGRTTASKNWQPNNWLLASLEFPLIYTSCFKRSVDAQNLVVEWISEKLCHFDVSNGIQAVNCLPAAYADTTVRCLSSKALRLLIDSANCLSLSLLIGMSLSAAVLRNAFDHALSLETGSQNFPPLLKLQIAKIYDLRAKSLSMDSFLTAIGLALRRSILRKKRATVVLSDDSSDNSCAAVPVASVRSIQVC
jgi:hypothetical protein